MLHTKVAEIIGVGWIGLIIYWIVSATKSKRNLKHTYSKFIGFRLVIFIVLVLLSTAVRGSSKYGYSYFYLKSHTLQILGLVLFASGIMLAVWARTTLSTNWGMPMSEKEKPELVTSGPYKYIRHPIYTSFILSMTGTALAISLYWFIILLSVGAYFIYSAKAEEKYLLKQFGKTYTAYQKTTKMLIPFII